MASSNSKSSISAYRKSNAESVLKSSGIRSSLLVHAHGIEVLNEYKKIIKDEGLLLEDEKKLAKALHDGLKGVILEKETAISQAMRKVFEDHWKAGTTKGEKNEAVTGESQGMTLTGHPDVVLRVAVVCKDDTRTQENAGVDKEQEGGDEESNNLVSNIFEVAVDKNGGEKKHLQAYDYCRFISNKGETFLFCVMHVDRSQDGSKLAITQESFIYKHAEGKEEQKYGFLWREYEFSKSKDGIESTLEKACQGIVRSIHCSTFIQKLNPYTDYWKTLHNNVAVQGSIRDDDILVKEWVYKVFDNRFRPTQRKPENWLQKEWSQHLQVEEYLVYEENVGAKKYLGKPMDESTLRVKQSGHDNPSPRKRLKTETDQILEPMPYGDGSIVVIRYKYQNGTHTASKLSHLRDIAHSIQEMHNKNIVHGDIRGHNLLHPHDDAGSIAKSCLLDFDLSGEHEKDKYPVGLNPTVPENSINIRKVKAGGVMKKKDDWIAFGSSIGVYEFPSDYFGKPYWEWSRIVSHYQVGDVNIIKEPTKAIDDFIKEYGDIKLCLREPYEFKGNREP